MTNVRGKASNCLTLLKNNTCLETIDGSIILTNLTMDKLYGVMICGVMDPKNLTFPSINVTNRAIKTKANRLIINSKEFKKSKTGLIIGIILGVVGAIILAGCIAFIIFYRRQKRENIIAKMTIANMEKDLKERYVDMPKKNDTWELERRQLLIYDDKKLGSGAFGAVYLAKLIGKAEGSKDAQSTLGVNLMRAENCLVAVKMLPEYADDLSKSEFLREIGLMKTLGYHERLVNMLACVTESEPYYLVVEYCGDGDLLHFLREKCKYMLMVCLLL
uniref:Protein kinase domain-containing protein n=1 Tax=Panagrolaimus davidi TaxID=227884 RepID=A0A914P997_9BILA